jgi:hypothetical protein
MFASLVVPKPFGQPEINHINGFYSLSFADHEVIGLDIAVNESLAMNLLQTGDDLNTDINCGGKTEFFLAE